MRFKRFTAGIVAAVMAVTAVGTPIADELPLFQNNSGVVAGAEENYDKTVCVGQSFSITISSRRDQDFVITGADESIMSYSLTGCGIMISGHITYTKTYKVNITESGSYNLLIYGEYGAPLSYKVLVREHTDDGTWHIDVKETCTSDGQKSRVCLYCNEKFDVTVIPALGHDFSSEWTIDKDVTCVEDGEKSRHCTRCDEKTDVTKIPSVGKHDYIATVVKPTYTAQGYTLHKCSVCGYSYKDNETAKLTLAKVSGFKVKSKTSTSVTLQWNKNSSASGYEIEQYKSGKWVNVAKITGNATTSYTVKGLAAGTAGYQFRIRAYRTEGKNKAYSGYSATVKVNTNPYGVGGFKCSSKSSTSVTLKWNKGTTASGYQLQQYKDGKWVTIYTGTKATNTSYTVKGLKAGTAGYRFRIRAYKTYGNTKQYGSWSSEVKVNTNPYGVGGFKAKSTAKTSITLGWNKGTTASGYQLQQYKGGKWVTVYTGTKATSTSCTIKSLKANTSYKFRIRAYKTYGNTKQYGSWSKVLTVKTKR